MAIELWVVQFWSEIILVILFDFEITGMISDQIALHSVQLPLYIKLFNIVLRLRGLNQIKETLILNHIKIGQLTHKFVC